MSRFLVVTISFVVLCACAREPADGSQVESTSGVVVPAFNPSVQPQDCAPAPFWKGQRRSYELCQRLAQDEASGREPCRPLGSELTPQPLPTGAPGATAGGPVVDPKRDANGTDQLVAQRCADALGQRPNWLDLYVEQCKVERSQLEQDCMSGKLQPTPPPEYAACGRVEPRITGASADAVDQNIQATWAMNTLGRNGYAPVRAVPGDSLRQETTNSPLFFRLEAAVPAGRAIQFFLRRNRTGQRVQSDRLNPGAFLANEPCLSPMRDCHVMYVPMSVIAQPALMRGWESTTVPETVHVTAAVVDAASGAQRGNACENEIGLVTPLVLDLAARAELPTITLAESTARFDLAATGGRRRTGWFDADTAILALDRNGNGTIDDGRELFGSATPIGKRAARDGYEALAQYDRDGDGEITARDPVFKKLRAWIDANGDGVSQPSELRTLASLGIDAIGTRPTARPERGAKPTPFGNVVALQARYYGPPQCPKDGCRSYDVLLRTWSDDTAMVWRP
jgi:hypothetical protein